MTKKFMTWWLVTVIQCIVLGAAAYLGAVEFLWNADTTKLSFLIIVMFIASTVNMGYISYNQKENYDNPYFVSEACMTVGMIGTVIGFMLMLGSSFDAIDPSNVDSMRRVITDMASGMSTALLTTLAGLVASLFLKTQIVIQEHDNA